ncbi:hypothetical protein Pmani_007279 [Petrolisthes manimaculis]|uniref:Kazal-like domain-containing protein n=1 Tax=Petrolisthes manimaculis TaxID=1843537 RepID=A0AAE1UFS9_9EUCA|nr:hypothetical protein Pmani_007279 [Petrolisthes manimaculis]
MAWSWSVAVVFVLPMMMMMITGVLCHDCPPNCSPTLHRGPVCGSNGRTYPTECDLKKDACRMPLLGSFLRKSYNGRCTGGSRPGGIQVSVGGISVGVGGGGGVGVGAGGGGCRGNKCRREPYQPVCGSDGRTYDNPCQLKERNRCHDSYLRQQYYGFCLGGGGGGGNCPQLHYCSLDHRPVCGSDGRTYNNDCEFQRAACHNRYLSVNYHGQCYGGGGPIGPGGCYTNNNCPTQAYDPVCGNDGRTYPSYCHLQHAQQCTDPHLVLRHRGPCVSPGFDVRNHARPVTNLASVNVQESPVEDPEHSINTLPDQVRSEPGVGGEQSPPVIIKVIPAAGLLAGGDEGTVEVRVGGSPLGEEQETLMYGGVADAGVNSKGLGGGVGDEGLVEEFAAPVGREEQEGLESETAVEVGVEEKLSAGKRGEEVQKIKSEGEINEDTEENERTRAEKIEQEDERIRSEDTEEDEGNERALEIEDEEDEISDEE